MRSYCTLFLLLLSSIAFSQGKILEMKQGKVQFSSKAPKELISSSSKKLVGLLDIDKRQFAFKIDITSFEGFNSPLQKNHFNENYMESSIYPSAVFKGKIIETLDLGQPGTIKIRAKGKLSIHGVDQERIINVVLKIGQKIEIKSDFTVLLADHNIKIPRVVTDKLSPEIQVAVDGIMETKQ